MENNIFLNAIKEEQKKNLRFMLIESCENGKVLAVKNCSENCDYMLHDLAEKADEKNVFICLYDSKNEDAGVLKSACDFIKKAGLQLIGNTSWIPSFA